ncbi:MAG: hypothetical protein JWM69_712 [Candidatus Binatus sp.]|nr:hypothetical protein [Candidatus Binatus sp.]
MREDANVVRAELNVRLRSSFIYLANAVNDLRGNWAVLAVVLAPLVFAAALCLLPDALNLQARLVTTFAPGGQNVSYTQNVRYTAVQMPIAPSPERRAAAAPQPFSNWVTNTLHILFGLLTLLATLVTLVALARIQSGARAPTIMREAVEVYLRSIRLTPGFLWVTFLQLLAPALGLILFQVAVTYLPNSMNVGVYIFLVMMIMLGGVIYLWLYFAQYALIFGGHHSWHALLFSRDLMRKRFFKVAIRIIVFLAVWSGYNSWAAGAFVVVSLLFGPVGVVTGSIGATIFLVDLFSIGVSIATAAFFVTASLRLYQDLAGTVVTVPSVEIAMQRTAPLPSVSA